MNRLLLALCALLLSVWVTHIESLENIDTKEPIVKISPALVNSNVTDDLFGYSVVVHQVEVSNDFESAIRNSRLIVGAPKGTFPGGILSFLESNPSNLAENETGLVYECPLATNTCLPLGWENSGNPNDRRLFDNEPDGTSLNKGMIILSDGRRINTSNEEQKSGQLMGQVLKSNGDFFMACAPRWITISTRPIAIDNRRSIGHCFLSGRNLSNFVEVRPCRGDTNAQTPASDLGENRCSAGFGASLDKIADQTRILVSAPGFMRGTGITYAYTDASSLSSLSTPNGNTPFETFRSSVYDGWSLAIGDLTRSGMEQAVISGMPRHDSQRLYGRVNIRDLTLSSTFSTIRNPPVLTGQQTGEFFGHVVETADLNDDGQDEIIVGAPMYSTLSGTETGRVFVFENIGNNFNNSNPIILTGFKEGGRFGHSIVNMGDINGDNIEDIAVGAPYERTANPNAVGVVYIYYGSRESVISRGPSQVISSEVVLKSPVSSLLTFGFSLGSQVDVDANGYKDLAIGAYDSQNAVLLRTLSIAILDLRLTADPNTVVVRVDTTFTVELCANYTGRGLSGRPLEVSYELVEVVQVLNGNPIPRVTERSYSGTLSFSDINNEACRSNPINLVSTTSLQNGLNLRQPIVMRVSFIPIERPEATNSNQLSDFRDFPLIRVAGNSTVSVTPTLACETLNNEEVCRPDLAIISSTVTYRGAGTMDFEAIVASAVIAVRFQLRVKNMGKDPAISSILNFNLPSTFPFTGVNIISGTMSPCSNPGGNLSLYRCPLSTLIAKDDMIDVTLDWIVNSNMVTGMEPNVNAIFTVDLPTGGPDMDNDTSNNRETIILPVTALTDLEVDLTVNGPQHYDEQSPLNTLETLSDVGETVDITVLVSNLGSSAVPNARLEVNVPVDASGSYYLYIGRLQLSGDEDRVNCSTNGVNPDRLMFTARSRRRRRSLTKRQANPSSEVSLSCPFDGTASSACFNFVCNIENFRPSQQITVLLLAALDRRFYQNRNEDFSFRPYARVTSLGDFAQFDVDTDNNIDNTIYRVSPLPDPPIDIHLEIWLPIVGGVLALILIILLFICCIYCGFFRKKRLEQAKKEAEVEFEVRQVPPEAPAVVTGEDTKKELDQEEEVKATDSRDGTDLEEGEQDKDPEETSL